MGGFVNDGAVDALQKLQIDHMFQRAWAVGPGGQHRSHTLRRCQILAIDMRDRGRPLGIGEVAGARRAALGEGPHGAHRHIGVGAHGDIVAKARPVVLQRLTINREARLTRRIIHCSVMGAGGQIGDGPAEIIEEAVGRRPAAYQSAGQGWQPGHGVIAAQPPELRDHTRRPIGGADLCAVGDDGANTMRAHQIRPRRLRVKAEIMVDVPLHGGGIEFIDLQPGGLWRGGVVGGAQQRRTQPDHPPCLPSGQGGRRPIQRAIGVHMRGNIDHAGGRGAAGAITGITQRIIIRHQRKPRLGLGTVDLRGAAQGKFGDMHRAAGGGLGSAGEHFPRRDAVTARRHIGHAERHRRQNQPERFGGDGGKADRGRHLGQRDIGDFGPNSTVHAGLQPGLKGGAGEHARCAGNEQTQRTHRLRSGIAERQRGHLAGDTRQIDTLPGGVCQGGGVQRRARAITRLGQRHGRGDRHRHRQHRDIGIISGGGLGTLAVQDFIHRRRLGQRLIRPRDRGRRA